MRTCIDNRKRKVFNDIKHLSTKAVLLIIFLSLLPALQVMAMETPDETQQKSTIRVQGRVLDEFNHPLPGVSILAVKATKSDANDESSCRILQIRIRRKTYKPYKEE